MQRPLVRDSQQSVQCNWYRAFPDPSYQVDQGVAQINANKEQFIRELQAPPFGQTAWWIATQGYRVLRETFPGGMWESGDLQVTYDPNVMGLGIYDWLVPLGSGTSPAAKPDMRLYRDSCWFVRGEKTVVGVGTVSSVGTTITGVGTSFNTFFNPTGGDIFVTAGKSYVVSSVASATSLVLTSAPPSVATITYSKGVDSFLQYPVQQIIQVRDTATTYVNGTDYVLGSDGETLQWLSSHCPAPGATYSALYLYYPRYEVVNLGTPRPVVNGQMSLASVAAKLWKPDHYTA